MATPQRVQRPALKLLEQAHGEERAKEIFQDKILRKPLYLKPTDPDEKDTTDARDRRQRARDIREALKKRKNRKPKPLSAKEKRQMGVHDIPKEERIYKIYEPLNNLWQGYIREILNLEGRSSVSQVDMKTAGPLLASADYHFALIEVVRSNCVGRVGTKGLVLKDRKFTYEIITKDNQVKVIPKEGTFFKIEVPLVAEQVRGDAQPELQTLVFELSGSSFINRAAERATKKIRLHLPPDL